MKLSTTIFFAMTMFPSTLLADELSQNCENLIADFRNNYNSRAFKIESVYECGPNLTHIGGRRPADVEACLVYFSSELNPQTSSIVAAFSDAANNNSVDWIPQDQKSGIASGWNTTGTYFCADIKTYVRAKSNGDTADVEIIRETARDAMFCPVRKLFTSYQTTCRLVSQK